MVLVLMRLFQKVLSAGKIPACVKFIFDKPMRSFHIALIGLSPDGNSFMSRSEGTFNNFSKESFFLRLFHGAVNSVPLSVWIVISAGLTP